MWDCLVALSTWVEKNSGQIQIIIAFGAIYLAYKGYVKVLEQIIIAKEQSQTTLKINTLELLNENIEKSYNVINKLDSLIREYEYLHGRLLESDDKETIKVYEYLTQSKVTRENCLLNTEKLIEKLKEIADSTHPLSENNLSGLYVILMRAISVENSFTPLSLTLEEYKKAKGY